MILLSVAAIGLRELWTSTFTTVIMIIVLAVTIFTIIKDLRSR
ncbi:hypothetical protein CHCC14817_0116 [Bacillus paralicheniformis]|nr:hypothetical protein CHCC15136_2165 [Bacillus paralicheniformis]TWM51715.1 hypothetical protein CHCC14817_0116 [Bacillus paralicheniformis]TWN64582.1 hypothetical protein CHCC12620_0281 [Bacillus paralicheniformis]